MKAYILGYKNKNNEVYNFGTIGIFNTIEEVASKMLSSEHFIYLFNYIDYKDGGKTKAIERNKLTDLLKDDFSKYCRASYEGKKNYYSVTEVKIGDK